MKTQQQILNDLITDFAAAQDKVTYFGDDSVIRAIFHGISYELSEVWHTLYQTKRQNYLLTARGTDLDYIGAIKSLPRRAASQASAILTFVGDLNTIIPAGTIVADAAGVKQYQTVYSIQLGKNYGLFNPTTYNPTINDSVLAESVASGSAIKAGSLELTRIMSPGITGVSSVVNYTGSAGGADAESDDDYRARLIERLSVLALDTRSFYEQLAYEASSTLLKSKAVYDSLNLGTKIYVVKNSLSNYTVNELNGIRNYIYSKQKALSPIAVINATIRDIAIEVTYKGTGNLYPESAIYSKIADTIATYLSSIFDIGTRVDIFEMYRRVIAIEGIDEINQQQFLVNGETLDVQCSDSQVPRFTYLKVTCSTSIANAIMQEYRLVQ